MKAEGENQNTLHQEKPTVYNINPTNYDFFIIESLYIRLNISGCLQIAWSYHKSSHAKSKSFQSTALTIKLLQLQGSHQYRRG